MCADPDLSPMKYKPRGGPGSRSGLDDVQSQEPRSRPALSGLSRVGPLETILSRSTPLERTASAVAVPAVAAAATILREGFSAFRNCLRHWMVPARAAVRLLETGRFPRHGAERAVHNGTRRPCSTCEKLSLRRHGRPVEALPEPLTSSSRASAFPPIPMLHASETSASNSVLAHRDGDQTIDRSFELQVPLLECGFGPLTTPDHTHLHAFVHP